jgi:hypothetical protein
MTGPRVNALMEVIGYAVVFGVLLWVIAWAAES